MRFDWLMRVHYNAVLHCGLQYCLDVSVPPTPLQLCFLAKNISKTIELLKYKIFQEEE
jgi:hypothetical protein